MTITVDSFKKEYVASVEFNEGDFIVVTKDNIEPLRKILQKTNFQWCSGHKITHATYFNIDRVIFLSKSASTYLNFPQINNHKHADYADAINYVFVNY